MHFLKYIKFSALLDCLSGPENPDALLLLQLSRSGPVYGLDDKLWGGGHMEAGWQLEARVQ